MKEKIFILAFAGSLRRNSYNKALLKVASETAPKNAKIEIFELDGIPLFNQDMENQPPKKVKEFKAKIRKADAILIATPEYNYSIPGVLKNAIDWASRPYDDNALEGKPVAVMSASIGMLGGARAQYHLRQVFVALDMYPVNDPEVLVSYAHKKIDDQGNVHDKETIERIKHLVEALVEWTAKLEG